MKENRASEEGKKNGDKSVVSPFIQSIKTFVNKLDPDGEIKDKDSSPEGSDKKGSDAQTVSSENPNHLENPKTSENTKKEYFKKPKLMQSNSKTEEDDAGSASESTVKEEELSEKSSELPLITLFHQAEERVSHIFKSDRNQIIRMGGLILAALLIILGIILLLGSADKVTDNVISGERAVISAFLIIVGLLLIAGITASKIVGKTSFDDLFNEVQILEGKKSSDDDKNKSEKKVKSKVGPKVEPKADSMVDKYREDKDK